MIRSKPLLTALALTAAATVASAATRDIEYVGTSGMTITLANTVTNASTNISTTTYFRDYLSGAMSFNTLGGTGSFEAFCIELGQGYASTGFQSYTSGSFGAPQATLLQGLFSSSYESLASLQDKAAFQTAVWEITHETSGALDAGNGSFQFRFVSQTSTEAEDVAFRNQVNGLLSAASSYSGQSIYALTKLENPVYQDLVMATHMPEPETYGMLLSGMAVIAFVARRRQKR